MEEKETVAVFVSNKGNVSVVNLDDGTNYYSYDNNGKTGHVFESNFNYDCDSDESYENRSSAGKYALVGALVVAGAIVAVTKGKSFYEKHIKEKYIKL